MENKERIYYTTEQLAEMMQVTDETIRNYIRGGKMGATKIGRDYRVSDVDLYNFLEKNRNEVK